MTNKDAANILITMYSLHSKQYGTAPDKTEALRLAVEALYREEQNQLSELLVDVKAIRLLLANISRS